MSELIQFASLRAAPWKNGGGCTTQIAAMPAGAGFDQFDWRVSLATISASGPFSTFPGIDRTLALVEGDGVLLDLDGARFMLSDSDPQVSFAGEAAVHATVAGGPTTDFNVMTRRARCRHRLERLPLRGSVQLVPRGACTLLFLAEGESLTISSSGERIALVRYDAVLLSPGQSWTMEAPMATVFVVDITPG